MLEPAEEGFHLEYIAASNYLVPEFLRMAGMFWTLVLCSHLKKFLLQKQLFHVITNIFSFNYLFNI